MSDLGKEIGPKLRPRNARFFLDLEHADQRDSPLGPSRYCALLDPTLAGKVGWAEAMLGQQELEVIIRHGRDSCTTNNARQGNTLRKSLTTS